MPAPADERDDDPAWLAWRERFAADFDAQNYASPLQRAVMRASHRLLERRHGAAAQFDRVLEIGAGTGAHLAHVRHGFAQYCLTDADPRALAVARERLGNADPRVQFQCTAGERLAYPDGSFDRVIAAHVLEHIVHPHRAVREWLRVLRAGGTLSVLIPTDPGLAWRLGRRLGPRRRALARGVAYDYVMAREHVNSASGLVAILRHLLPGARESWWPLRVPALDANLFIAFDATVPRAAARPAR